MANTHVKSAEFSPSYAPDKINLDQTSNCNIQSQFLSTTINQLSIWDTSIEKTPIHRIETSDSPLNCASWSPNDPQSLVVCGGYERKLVIIDTRVGNAVWTANKAHYRPIRDAKFNPFISYWLASAGNHSHYLTCCNRTRLFTNLYIYRRRFPCKYMGYQSFITFTCSKN